MPDVPTAPGAIFHDYMAAFDGGGRLSLTLADCMRWPLITGSLSARLGIGDSWPRVDISALGPTMPFALPRILHQVLLWRRHVSTYRRIVYSGHYAPLAAPNHPRSASIYYCHTPPRYAYDQAALWMNSLPTVYRPAARRFVRWYRAEFERAIHHIPRIIVNSQNVRRRVRDYLDRDADVVYPPCRVESYCWREARGYYLSTARHDPAKRVDRIVDAFRHMPSHRLIVTSDGPRRASLTRTAAGASNITFTGPVSDDRLRDLLSECIATIYIPVDEDFGMSPVESMASGKPVIGVAEGGLPESIADGETGLLVAPGVPVDALVDAVQNLTARRAAVMRQACIERAARFDAQHFCQHMRRIIHESG